MNRQLAWIQPDPKLVLRTHQQMRHRQAVREALGELSLDRHHRHWDTLSPLERRTAWRDAGCPRFLYKYRGSLKTLEGLRRAEDILLRHQLWLADASKYSDHQ